tara:strand:- start:74 stop:247 length:174 start_codon:yes stop_codon:yes gene_type:complete
MMKLGLVLMLYRESAGITKKELAKKLNINVSSVDRLEMGKNIQAPTLAKIMIWLTKP